LGVSAASARDHEAGEAELRSRLAAIVESSTDAILGKTLDGVITSWNAGAERMYGYTAQEIVGRNVAVLIPADRPGELMPILDKVRRGERLEHFETRRRRKDGTIIDVSVSVSPIRDAAGAIAGAATVARDISDRKQAEAAYQAVSARLRHAERMETVGQLTSSIAHDFRNLLGIITGYARLMAEEPGAGHDTRRMAGEILAVSDRAVRITRDLLLFSRRGRAEPEPVDLSALIVSVRELLAVGLGARYTVAAEPSPDPLPAVLFDRAQAEQVLLNLAVNARDAMPTGGTITIATSLAENYVEAGGSPSGRWVQLTVSDTGTGMSPEVVAHAFDPFFTTKPPGEGTGLGLSTVHGIIAGAGGSIEVQSQPGNGTRFCIRLPAIDTPAASSRPPSPEQVGNPPDLLQPTAVPN
jgi:two-component system, cell cycle sensor histidine kinase and response regulator CckA